MRKSNSIMARCRRATVLDADSLAAMQWDFYLEDGDQPAGERAVFEDECSRFIQAGLEAGTWEHFVAEIDARVVAMASIQLVQMMPRPSRARDALGYLTNVYTTPNYRNQGIGQGLLEYAKAWAQQQDLELLVVWPSWGSRSVYQRVGFRDDIEILELKIRQ